MDSSRVHIRKADGTLEAFQSDKLERSLKNSGAAAAVAHDIAEKVADSLKGGERTGDIYRRAFRMLRTQARGAAARYSVKRALIELGPTGYPFEDFVGEIFRAQGWTCRTRTERHGACVSHELDLVGTRDDRSFAAEVKYHNDHGLKSDLKVALYVRARFDDLKNKNDPDTNFSEVWLITNTKFSTQAIRYAECAGLRLLGWDYPEHGNLRELIDQTGAHPISCLTTLTAMQKRELMQQGVVLARQLHDQVPLLGKLGLSDHMIDTVLGETLRVAGER